ncbi:hypothetical protein WJX73_008492 [Symbiochloris irregularis]|uniref:J domain-containing protein n=1 Tax=Symbiochloris irregularis TaxID=706552 RepID=A0AAW1PEP4_9CHLO
MSAVDRVYNQLKHKHHEGPDLPPDCIARFLCTKSSWRGRYRRIICITPSAVITQFPDSLAVTNTWVFVEDSDIDGISLGTSDAEEPEFILSARVEKRGKFKPQKFACKHRSSLLSTLFQAIATAAVRGSCTVAPKLIGSADVYPAHKLRRGQWVPVQLRVSASAVDRLDASGQVRWRLEYRNMAKPAVRLLSSGQQDPPGVFALLGKVGRGPRVYASRDREALLRALQTAAHKRLGISVAVDPAGAISGQGLLDAVGSAEREMAATESQEPVGQWDAVRVRAAVGGHSSTSQALLSSPAEADDALQEPRAGARRRGVPRRLVLTASALLERRTSTYEVAEWRSLASIAAIVRFVEEPQWLAFEWLDGTPPSMFISAARDAILTATLDIAQGVAGRCIPVLPQHTFPGDVVVSGDAHPPPSPEDGRSTDGDESENLSVGSPPVEGSALVRRRSNLAAAFGNRSGGEARTATLRSFTHGQEAVAELHRRIAEFNACIPYSGLSGSLKVEEGLLAALLSLLPLIYLPAAGPSPREATASIAVLHCLQRLVSSPAAAASAVNIPGGLAREDATASGAKTQVLAPSGRCAALVGLLKAGGEMGGLAPMAGVVALAACVCPPGSSTTDLILLHALLTEAASLGRPLFRLFSHPARTVLDATALVMQAIAERGASAAVPMREAALTDGAILLHLSLALAAKGGARAKLSRDLIALWTDDYLPAMELLQRVFPAGLLRFLQQPRPNPQPQALGPSMAHQPQQQSLQAREAMAAASGRLGPKVATQSRGRRGNWDAFWAQVDKDHCNAGLIWNERTRSELRNALQAEEAALAGGRARTDSKAQGQRSAWNYAEFHVEYPCLAQELYIGDIYIKLLLEGLDQGAVQKLPAPLYHHHAATVGPFNGMAHSVALLDCTANGALQDVLLGLVHALLVPSSAATSPGAQRSAAANGAAFVRAGGVQLAVDMVAGAHAAQERVQAPLQTNLIAYTSHQQTVKEWYFYPTTTAATRPRDLPIEEGQQGPLTRDELKQAFAKGQVSRATLMWASGMAHPLPLGAIRQLRWMMSSPPGRMGAFDRAEVALEALLALAHRHPATDESGQALHPLPLVHRILASPQCLPHLAQVLLTGQPALVSLAAALLEVVVDHNSHALSRLPGTGIFFFALAYCGSNLVEIARLFQVAHLKAGKPTAAAAAGGPLAQSSILGPLLPESLLYVLTTHGAGAFSEALIADADTPELVWTHRMRAQVLVPQMYNHMGDLPRRLPQHNTALYDYVDCPPIAYTELQNELWCHRYYLRNLCDVERFPEWPIVDHVPFLQAMLDEWRAEVARKPLAMSEEQACKVLGLQLTPDGVVSEDDLKAAYRSLARKYHPDRNPAGREQFQAVAQAYERLQVGAAGGQGPQPWRLLLLLQAQCILYKRYPVVLEPFKYAGYPLLLQAVTLPEAEDAEGQGGPSAASQPHWLAPDSVPQLQAALELCWLTCVSSRLNGEELARSGGVAILGALLSRCATVLPRDAAPTAPAAIIATHALRTFAGMAAFPHARAELLARPGLVGDIVRACAMERAASAVDAALQAIIQMSALAELQDVILQQGGLGYLVPLLLGYDSTLGEESAGEEAASAQLLAAESDSKDAGVAVYLSLDMQRSNMQAARNLHAMLAARALACLAGVLPGSRATPSNAPAQEALSCLLTPPLAIRLCDADPRSLLVQLASSTSNPQVVWNSKMREQLLAQMEAARSDASAALPPSNFTYTAIQGELVVAGVFVRIFNEQPAYALSDAAAFAKGLVTWVNACAGASLGPDAQQLTKSSQGHEAGEEALSELGRQRAHLAGALTALRNVVEAQPRLAALLAARPALAPLLNCLSPICRRLHTFSEAPDPGQPGLLERLAQQQGSQVAQVQHEAESAALALAVLVRLTAHAGCVEALAEERAVLFALWLVHRPPTPTVQMLALRLLHALAGTAAAAWAAAAHAGYLYLLCVLLHTQGTVNEREAMAPVRAAVAVLLRHMMAQPLHGPRVALQLSQLLPQALIASLQEDAGEAAVAAVDQPCETPERVWTPHMATTTAEEALHLAAAARISQARGELQWTLPEGHQLQFEALANEMYVGGVYVRLFLKNPTFPLRSPKAFAEGLMESYVARALPKQGAASDSQTALLLSAAAVQLLRVQPLLAEHITGLGYVDAVLQLLSSRLPSSGAGVGARSASPDELGGSALRLLHQVTASPAGAEALARGAPPPVPALMQAGQAWGVAGSVLALETLQRGLQLNNRARSLLVGAALSAGLVPFLLAKLDWRTRAQQATVQEEERDEAVERVVAVEVLHLLAAEGLHAQAVQELLGQSEVWRAYKDQKHDLFLPAGATQQGGAGPSGLSTAPSRSVCLRISAICHGQHPAAVRSPTSPFR